MNPFIFINTPQYQIHRDAERFSNDLSRALISAQEAWLESCAQRFAPGIYALVKSGQLRAAAARIRVFNFHTRVYTFDRRRTDFMRGDVCLESSSLVIDL